MSAFPRHQLPVALCNEVDARLKSIQLASRHASKLLPLFVNEFRLLDRIYYKGNNQHHAALFWKQVQGIRRISNRILSVPVLQIFATILASFHGDSQPVKIGRSAWTQVPSPASLLLWARKLDYISDLMDKVVTTLETAHRVFSAQIHVPAFLHLTVILVAITARLRAVMVQLKPSIIAASSAGRYLADGLEMQPQRGVILPEAEDGILPPGSIISRETDHIKAKDLEDLKGIHTSDLSKAGKCDKGLDAKKAHSNNNYKFPARGSAELIIRATGPTKTRKRTPQVKKSDEIDDIFGF